MTYSAWKYSATRIAKRVKKVIAELKSITEANGKFDAVAVQGTSGTWLAPALIRAGYHVTLVRKLGENSHGQTVENAMCSAGSRYVFVDDFVDSGATLKPVQEQIAEYSGGYSEVAYVVLHGEGEQGWVKNSVYLKPK